jgi:hypothetical protein
MFLHLYKKVPPEAGIVCRICAKNVEIVRKSCRSYGYTAPAIYALQKALWCCEFGDDSFGGVVYQQKSQKSILSHSAFVERVGVCQSLQA